MNPPYPDYQLCDWSVTFIAIDTPICGSGGWALVKADAGPWLLLEEMCFLRHAPRLHRAIRAVQGERDCRPDGGDEPGVGRLARFSFRG